ncbi:MAG: aminoglycoside phosphotransferase family protein [Bdellovibrionales bacterium]
MQTEAEVQSFLRDAGWGAAQADPLAADFSSRRFRRLTRVGPTPSSAVLMCCEPNEKAEALVHMSALLRRLGLPVPDIYASDLVRHMVLMEDFGDRVVGRLLDEGSERAVYDEQAVALLAKLHRTFTQSMLGAFKFPLFNAAIFCDQVGVFLDHYYPRVFHRQASPRERSRFVEAWHGVLAPLDASVPRSLLLRDFMPDNMMALGAPVEGWPVGLLDYQDAGIGPIAYDLASWCEQVRREGGLAVLEGCVERYGSLNSVMEQQALLCATRIYAAQRHARILGRLVAMDRTAMIPLVWKTLQALLKHPELAPVRRWFASCAPPS